MHDSSNVPLVGAHPALDLVNSIERGVPRPEHANHDYLVDPDTVVMWAGRAGVLSDAEARAVAQAWAVDQSGARRALSRLIGIRESLYAILRAALGVTAWDGEETGRALEHLHREWKDAVSRSTITRGQPEPLVRVEVGGDPGELVSDRVVQQALELLSGDELGRLRECPIEAGGCGWLFLDHSRNGSRRWCRMADCGNKVKASRLTARRRAARAAEAEAGAR